MIVGFADEEPERVWQRSVSRRLPAGSRHKARLKPRMLHAATRLEDLRVPPADRLQALAGDRRGRHDIRIDDRWRICFRWHDGRATGVRIVGNH